MYDITLNKIDNLFNKTYLDNLYENLNQLHTKINNETSELWFDFLDNEIADEFFSNSYDAFNDWFNKLIDGEYDKFYRLIKNKDTIKLKYELNIIYKDLEFVNFFKISNKEKQNNILLTENYCIIAYKNKKELNKTLATYKDLYPTQLELLKSTNINYCILIK